MFTNIFNSIKFVFDVVFSARFEVIDAMDLYVANFGNRRHFLHPVKGQSGLD